MKKTLLILLSALLVFSLIGSALAGNGAAGTSSVTGKTTTLQTGSVENGTEFDVSFDITIDTAYDNFDSAAFVLTWDDNVITPITDRGGSTATGGMYVIGDYAVDPSRDPNVDGKMYALLINNNVFPPDASGYCTTATITMKVVDAAALKAAGSAQITITVLNGDFSVKVDGETYCADDYKDVMAVNVSPMTVTVKAAETWKVTFNTNGGNTIAPIDVVKGQSVILTNPTKAGSTFDGWYTDSALTNKVTANNYSPTSDVTLYAKWNVTPADTWKITYDTTGGNTINAVDVEKGKSVTLAIPTKAGNSFDGWYTESALTNKITSATYTPTSNITLYAKWVETWKVTYETNGGNTISAVEVEKGKSITLATPTKAGSTFDGWYTESALTNKITTASYIPTSNITLYAKWVVKAETWKVTYETNGGNTISAVEVEKGKNITLATPTKAGSTFDGWYTESALTNKITTATYTPTSDITLYAKWTASAPVVNTWKVTYETNGGNTISAVDVEKGKSVTLPTPSKSGYTFGGWYTDSALSNKIGTSTFTPVADTTLYAKWVAANNGSTVPKTGVDNMFNSLLVAMCTLFVAGGVVVSVRARKIRSKR